jgi:hypothetical protein
MSPFSSDFSKIDLKMIISANIGVDITNPTEAPAHYMPGTEVAAEALITRFLKLAIQMELAGLHDSAMYFLGIGLHALQDKYAHCEQNAGWRKHLKSLRGAPSPDDPAFHADQYFRARNASAAYIGSFLEGIGRRKY